MIASKFINQRGGGLVFYTLIGIPSVANHGKCTISPQISLLIPLINGFDIDCQSINQQKHIPTPGVSTLNKPWERAAIRIFKIPSKYCDATNLAASIDGVPLQFVRVQSPPGAMMLVPLSRECELPTYSDD